VIHAEQKEIKNVDDLLADKYTSDYLSQRKVDVIARALDPLGSFEMLNASRKKKGLKPFPMSFFDNAIMKRRAVLRGELHSGASSRQKKRHIKKLLDFDDDSEFEEKEYDAASAGQRFAAKKRHAHFKVEVLREINNEKREKFKQQRRGKPREFEDVTSGMFVRAEIRRSQPKSIHPNKLRKQLAKEERQRKIDASLVEREEFLSLKQDKRALKRKQRKERRKEGRLVTESLIENIKLPVVGEYITDILGYSFSEMFEEQRDIVICINFCYQVYRSRNVADALSALTSLRLANGGTFNITDVVWSTLVSKVRSWVSSDKEERLQTESLSDSLQGFKVFLNSIVTCEFANMMKHIITTLAVMKFFPSNYVRLAKKWVGFDFKGKSITGFALIDSISELFIKVLQMGECWLNGTPFSQIFLAADPIEEAIKKTKLMALYKDALYDGLPVVGFKERKAYMAELEELIASLEYMLKHISPFSSQKNMIEKCLFDNKAIFQEQVMVMQGSKRQTPFCFVLWGDPGVGKSVVVPFLFQLHAKVKGIDFMDGMIYPKVASEPYYEGHNPLSQPYIFISEAGSKATSLVKNTGDDALLEICSIVDSLPKMLHMAFDKKGKVFCMPDMVGIDTNNQTMSIELIKFNYAADLRRMQFIRQEVKPEYRLPGSTQIDKVKALRVGALEPFRFTLSRFESQGPRKAIEIIEEKDIDAHMLAKVMAEKYATHIEHEATILERYKSGAMYDEWLNSGFPECDEESILPEPLNENFSLMNLDHACDDGDEECKSHPPPLITESLRAHDLWKDAWCWMLMLLLKLKLILDIVPEFVTSLISIVSEVSFESLFYTKWAYLGLLIIYQYNFWMFTTAFLVLLNHKSIVLAAAKVALSMKYRQTKSNLFARAKSVRHMMGGKWEARAFSYAPIIAGVGAVALILRKTMKSISKEALGTESNINEIENNLGAAVPMKQIEIGHGVKIWNDRIVPDPPLHNGDVTSLENAVLSSCRACFVTSDGVRQKTQLFGVQGCFALVNLHSLGTGNKITFEVPSGTAYGNDDKIKSTSYMTTIKRKDIVIVNDDIALVELSGILFKAGDRIIKHFPSIEGFQGSIPIRVGGTSSAGRYKNQSHILDDAVVGEYRVGALIQYRWDNHAKGLCGTPVFGTVSGGSYILGLHTASAKLSYATPLTRRMIEQALLQAKEKSLLVPLSGDDDKICLTEGEILPLNDPGPKSIVKHMYCGGMKYYGKAPGYVNVNKKSRITRVPNYIVLTSTLASMLPPNEDKYTIPIMKPRMDDEGNYIYPYNIAMSKLRKERPSLDRDVLRQCINAYKAHILDKLSDKGITELSPFPLEMAINGGGDIYPTFRRVNAKTSSGFGRSGNKEKYLPLIDDVTRVATAEVKEEVERIFSRYENEELYHHIYTLHLKDEPREKEKVEAGKVRVFSGSSLGNLLVSRMLLGPMYSLISTNGDAFCSAVGINMYEGADQFVHNMIDFSPFLLEGDYSGFDQSMPFDISWAAATLQYELLKELGYNEKALRAVKGLLSDTLFPTVDLNNDIFCIPGYQPSGKFGTAEENGLKNNIMVLYKWYTHEILRKYHFFDYMKPVTYGDDILIAIKEEMLKYFNNITYQHFCKEHYDITFTSPAKGLEMEKFVTIDTCSFLKRRFIFKPELNRYVAPLDPQSIYRMATWFLPSKSVTELQQHRDCLESLLYELSLHVDADDYRRFKTVAEEWLLDQGAELEDIYLPGLNQVTRSMFGEGLE